ncbi:MAG: PQQ-dependent sugar dehydrogenase [Chthoniobacterales bacterium]
MLRSLRALALLVVLAPCVSPAQDVIKSEKANFKAEPFIADGLKEPWGMAELPDGNFLVTEKGGNLRVIVDGKLLPDPIKGTPKVDAGGQGGMFEVILHPDYAKNGWIYLAFADEKPGGGSTTKIVRGRIKNGEWVDQQTIFEAAADQYTRGGLQFGGRIAFDGKGYIYFTIGDRGGPTTPENAAQKLSSVAGKVHRLFDDGRVPPDNPFVGRAGALPSIWSYGHRNQQGFTFDDKGNLWATEHGPRGGDELNLILKGRNYGWAIVTYGINYSGTKITDMTTAPGIEGPRTYWVPSIATCGLAFYNGDKFPGWKGDLFVGALAHRKIVRVEYDADNKVTHEEILLAGKGRVRTILPAADGTIYVAYNDPDSIVRLVPAN